MIRKKYFQITIWVLIFELVSFCLGMITKSNIVSWYQVLNKSTLTPPGFVFSIVWTILYAVLALVGSELWNNRKDPQIKIALYFYIVQIVMNWLWTPLFFYFHYIFLSFLWIVMMLVLVFVIMFLIKNKLKFINILLIPYIIWLSFAAYLNAIICILN